MKNRWTVFTLCTLLGAGLALGQDQTASAPADGAVQKTAHPQPDPNRQLRRLTKQLNLTADQQNQILPILSDRRQQIAGIQNDSSLSNQDRHVKARAIREESDAKLKAVLTDVQKQQYDQLQQQMKERATQRREQPKN